MYGLPRDLVIPLVLGFARLYGFMYFFPLISGDQVPAMARGIVCLALTPYVVMPYLASGVELHSDASSHFYALLIKEVGLGALLGLLVGLPLRLPEIIGNMIDNQRGSAVTDTFNPTSGSDASLLGQLMSLTMVVYFFSSGGFDQLVVMLAGSFKLMPMDQFTIGAVADNVWALALEMFIRYLTVFVILTLPVMAAMFLAEISLAMASRFAQSLNVFSLAQPVKSLVAISMLITLMPKINREVVSYLNDMLERFGA